jgi:hypothetical protein
VAREAGKEISPCLEKRGVSQVTSALGFPVSGQLGPRERRISVKLWGTVAVAALGVLAPAMGRADIVGYTFTVPVKIGTVSGLDISDSGPL